MSVEKKRLIAEAQNWDCAICNEKFPEGGSLFEVDHIHPLFLGGTNEQDNLQALCPNCHVLKARRERAEDHERKQQREGTTGCCGNGRWAVFTTGGGGAVPPRRRRCPILALLDLLIIRRRRCPHPAAPGVCCSAARPGLALRRGR